MVGWLGPPPEFLIWSLRICTLNKIPGDADDLGPITTFRPTGLESTGQVIGFFFGGKISIGISGLIMAFLSNNFQLYRKNFGGMNSNPLVNWNLNIEKSYENRKQLIELLNSCFKRLFALICVGLSAGMFLLKPSIKDPTEIFDLETQTMS